jgi:hypothetical protein
MDEANVTVLLEFQIAAFWTAPTGESQNVEAEL